MRDDTRAAKRSVCLCVVGSVFAFLARERDYDTLHPLPSSSPPALARRRGHSVRLAASIFLPSPRPKASPNLLSRSPVRFPASCNEEMNVCLSNLLLLPRPSLPRPPSPSQHPPRPLLSCHSHRPCHTPAQRPCLPPRTCSLRPHPPKTPTPRAVALPRSRAHGPGSVVAEVRRARAVAVGHRV